MNLEGRIDPRLWDAIHLHVDAGDSTAAIQDAIHFLSGLIREKADLDGDGTALVGQAFGGDSPRLKVNKFQTETERSEQRGIESILRGIYQAIRNPRSHEKYKDKPADAEALILFVNYLVSVIDQARPPFVVGTYIKRLFDPDFVADERYADLLINEIPARRRLDVFVELYRKKEECNTAKLRQFVKKLLATLDKAAHEQVVSVISEELRHTHSNTCISSTVDLCPAELWPKLDEDVRIRMENKLNRSVSAGYYDADQEQCLDGHLGTWARVVGPYFDSSDWLVHVLMRKLASKDRCEQDYVFEYFFSYIDKIVESPPQRWIDVIANGLACGDKRFKRALDIMFLFGVDSKPWLKALEERYESFEEVEETISDIGAESLVAEDQLPF